MLGEILILKESVLRFKLETDVTHCHVPIPFGHAGHRMNGVNRCWSPPQAGTSLLSELPDLSTFQSSSVEKKGLTPVSQDLLHLSRGASVNVIVL